MLLGDDFFLGSLFFGGVSLVGDFCGVCCEGIIFWVMVLWEMIFLGVILRG